MFDLFSNKRKSVFACSPLQSGTKEFLPVVAQPDTTIVSPQKEEDAL